MKPNYPRLDPLERDGKPVWRVDATDQYEDLETQLNALYATGYEVYQIFLTPIKGITNYVIIARLVK